MGKVKREIDLAICIDASLNMKELIEEVKERVINIEYDIRKAQPAYQANETLAFRFRLIVYRNIKEGSFENSIVASDFISLPEEREKFNKLVNSIATSSEESDCASSLLKALFDAVHSSWINNGNKSRHMIVLFTNASSCKLKSIPSSLVDYYKNAPKNFDEFADLWESQVMDDRFKRMLIFAPDEDPWRVIAETCDQVFWIVSKAGQGYSRKNTQELWRTAFIGT